MKIEIEDKEVVIKMSSACFSPLSLTIKRLFERAEKENDELIEATLYELITATEKFER